MSNLFHLIGTKIAVGIMSIALFLGATTTPATNTEVIKIATTTKETKVKSVIKNITEPTCNISVNPNTIKQGENAVVTWKSTNAMESYWAGIDTNDVNGSQTVSPSKTTIYAATFMNTSNNHSKVCSATLTVLNTSTSQNISNTPSSGTLCNGVNYSSCPSGQDFVCPSTGSAYCQIPKSATTPVQTYSPPPSTVYVPVPTTNYEYHPFYTPPPSNTMNCYTNGSAWGTVYTSCY